MASSGAAPEEVRFKVREEEPCLVGFAPGIADIELAHARFSMSEDGRIRGNPSSGSVTLSGDASASEESPVQHALALVDTDSGQASVHPLVGNSTVRLALVPHKLSADAAQRAQDPQHKREAASAQAAFASRKRQRAIERLKSRKAGVAPEQMPEHGAALADAELASAQSAHQSNGSAPYGADDQGTRAAHDVPPRNLDATSPAEAYPLNELSPDHQRESLERSDIMSAMQVAQMSGESDASALESDTVAEIARLVALGENPSSLDARAKVLAHLRALIRVYHWPRKLSKDSIKGQHLPQPVAENAVERFYEADPRGAGPRSRTGSKESLLMAYIVLLALHSTPNFKLQSTEPLANDLKVQPKKLAEVAKDLGCKRKRLGKSSRGKGSQASHPGVAHYTIWLELSEEEPLRNVLPGNPKMKRRNKTEA